MLEDNGLKQIPSIAVTDNKQYSTLVPKYSSLPTEWWTFCRSLLAVFQNNLFLAVHWFEKKKGVIVGSISLYQIT